MTKTSLRDIRSEHRSGSGTLMQRHHVCLIELVVAALGGGALICFLELMIFGGTIRHAAFRVILPSLPSGSELQQRRQESTVERSYQIMIQVEVVSPVRSCPLGVDSKIFLARPNASSLSFCDLLCHWDVAICQTDRFLPSSPVRASPMFSAT
eukprot:764874-Hanusia_phi.AAC.4